MSFHSMRLIICDITLSNIPKCYKDPHDLSLILSLSHFHHFTTTSTAIITMGWFDNDNADQVSIHLRS